MIPMMYRCLGADAAIADLRCIKCFPIRSYRKAKLLLTSSPTPFLKRVTIVGPPTHKEPLPMKTTRLPFLLLILVFGSGCATGPSIVNPETFIDDLAASAIPLPGNPSFNMPVSGANASAQSWFNQGMRYIYGFNHDAAAACFAQAAIASPQCAMAWWGIAHAYGIDVNDSTVTEDEATRALSAITRARTLLNDATQLEYLLIEAAAARTVAPPPAKGKRTDLDKAYSAATQKAHRFASDNPHVATLFVESLMLMQPWNYWTLDGKPLGRSKEIVGALEKILETNANHSGANHLYIHAVEASNTPERAVPCADRLGKIEPHNGHLVHMPSHIYIHVGRYADAVTVNKRACELDKAYFAAYKRPSMYTGYFLHNLKFASFACMMEGRRAEAIDYISRMETEIPEPMLRKLVARFDGHMASRFHVYIRFGMWDEILTVPEAPEYRLASHAIRRYARTVALANLGRTDEARHELAAFEKAATLVPKKWKIAYSPAKTILELARQVAVGEVLWREGNPVAAIAQLKSATRMEDDLSYNEPPSWLFPVRHALGAIQLASGDATSAAATFREDLQRNKGNAWSLLGLQQSLTKLGRTEEAAAMKSQVEMSWARADITPPASCYCGTPLTN